MNATRWLQVAWWMAMGCASGCDTPNTLEDACADYCGQVERADCANTVSRGQCELDCVSKGVLLEQCTTVWRDYVACMSGYPVTCDESGQSQLPEAACEKQQAKVDGCVSSASQTK